MWGCGGGTSEQVCGVVGVGPVSRFFRVVGVGPVIRCVGLWGWDQGVVGQVFTVCLAEAAACGSQCVR